MLGGFTLPSVMAFHISSMGTSDSDQGTVNSGESQRTIDDGSSYRSMRLSSLSPSMAFSMRTLLGLRKEDLRLRTITTIILPFSIPSFAQFWSGDDVDLLLRRQSPS
jgi:hypothetical protein